MAKKYHFISGLPRSGTTLFSSIMNQNPKFQASISGPLARFSRAIIQESSSQGGYRYQCPESKRKQIIHNMFDTYYDTDKEVFFDTNRGWTLLTPLISDLYPDAKILLFVRDISWILDSFETLFQKNPYTITNMFTTDEATNVYSRAETLMRSDRTLGFAYSALKQALMSNEYSKIKVIEYDTLAKYPEETIRSVYKFIGEEYYEGHDYSNVETPDVAEDFDGDVQLNGLHTLRQEVKFISRKSILPPDLFQNFVGAEVWRDPSFRKN